MGVFSRIVWIVLLVAGLCRPGAASVVVSLEELYLEGAGPEFFIVMSYSGSLSFDGPEVDAYTSTGAMLANGMLFGATGGMYGFVPMPVTGPDAFSSRAVNVRGDATEGMPFIFNFGTEIVGLPSSYVAGTECSGEGVFRGTFEVTGLERGRHVWTLGSGDTVTLQIGPAVVPAPAGGVLLIGALGALGAMRRRRRGG